MLEYKKVTVSDGAATSLINNYAKFGWTLKDSNSYGFTDHLVNTIGNVTYHENVHSVETSITFQRETTMPHYEEFKQIFLEYDQASSFKPYYPKKPSNRPSFGFSIAGAVYCLLIAAVLFGCAFACEIYWFILISIVLCVPAFFLIKLAVKIHREYEETVSNLNIKVSQNQKKAREALQKAEALINLPEVVEFLSKNIHSKADEAPKQNEHVTALSNADEIRKFKQLLEEGIITQEEFDQKKKELLGL